MMMFIVCYVRDRYVFQIAVMHFSGTNIILKLLRDEEGFNIRYIRCVQILHNHEPASSSKDRYLIKMLKEGAINEKAGYNLF